MSSEQQQVKTSSASGSGSGGNSKPQRKNKGNNEGQEVAKVNVLQQLKTVERVFRWPVVDTTWKQGVIVYDKIKGSNKLIKWSCGVVENTAFKVFSITLPVVNTFGTPIKYVDQKLDQGLVKLEQVAPIVKEPPAVILETTKQRVHSITQPTIERAQAMVQFSKGKANIVLATPPAMWALHNLDKVTDRVDQIIEKILPNKGKYENSQSTVPLADDPVQHVYETVTKVIGKLTGRVIVIFHA